MPAWSESKIIVECDLVTGRDDITGQKYKIQGLLIVREKTSERVVYPPTDRFYRAIIFPGESYQFQLSTTVGEILII